MKKILYILAVITLFSCAKKETYTVTESSLMDAKNPLNKLAFNNKIDFYCGMDITKYGVTDTVHYKSKLYGFCSKSCKEEFEKTPEKYLAKKFEE